MVRQQHANGIAHTLISLPLLLRRAQRTASHSRGDADGECKFWLDPVRLARNKNVAPHVVREMERLVYQNHDLLMRAYNEHLDR